MAEIVRIGGLELRFLETPEATGRGVTLFEMTVQPAARMPVPHYHETWDETVYGLAGTTVWRVDGRDVEVMPGRSLFIARGTVHGFDNRSDAAATCLCVLTPGHLGPDYFRDMAELAKGGPPDPERMKATMLRYGLVPAL